LSYTAATGSGRISGDLESRQLWRATVASSIGTTVEWYDAVLYGLLVPFYLGRLFFPAADPLASTLSGYLGLLVSFGARLVGGAFFGHFGDRMGRKATLIVTLTGGGVASGLIGFLPTHAQWGVWAPVLLLSLRACVGFALGGEWGGAVLLPLEWGNRRRRGFWAAWPQIGPVMASVLGFAAIAGSSWLVGAGSDWAWRLPFIVSFGLVLVGVYMRLGVLETPTFVRLREERRTERYPVRRVLARHWSKVVLAAMLQIGVQVPLVLTTTFFLVYSGMRGLPMGAAVGISILAGIVGAVCTPIAGYLSDLAGRRVIYLGGAVLMVVLAPVYFMLIGSADVRQTLTGAVLAQMCVALMSGAEAALISESFTGRLRYSGASLGAGLGAVLGGGVASALGVFLLQRFHAVGPVALYLIACCLLGAVAALLLRDRRKLDLSVEYDDPRAEIAPTPAARRA
jgi:MFS family permease